VKSGEGNCPFCGARLPLRGGFRQAVGAAVSLCMGLAVTACDENAASVYGPAPCAGVNCGNRQVCVHYSSNAAARCQAEEDGGCPAGLVPAASCYDQPSAAWVSPGCTNPPPTSRCVDIPDPCSDLCDCVCPADAGGTCDEPGLYVRCIRP
jgi:hypothetical protein